MAVCAATCITERVEVSGLRVYVLWILPWFESNRIALRKLRSASNFVHSTLLQFIRILRRESPVATLQFRHDKLT